MYPSQQTLTERFNLYDDHEVRRGDLTLDVSGTRASLSRVLEASSGKLTQKLASKMNVIRGLDVSWYLGHHTGGHLGNFARNDTNKVPNGARPTIDQVMAYSRSFYPDGSSFKQRSMHVGVDGNFSISWGYSNPVHGGQGSGSIQSVPTSYSSKDLFESVFVRESGTPKPSRVAVVDRVLASYKSLHGGAFGDAKRLSGADRRRLEEHMNRISELQQRVNVVAQCSNVREPGRQVDESTGGLRSQVILQDKTREFYQTFNDVIVAAFMCGTSRIATIYPQGFTPYAGDWHQEIAHTAGANEAAQATLAGENRRYFEEMFVDLISKLDVPEADGQTFLDNSLVMWTQESGPSTHDPISLPVVTAGSAAGFLKTGNYVDYRRLTGPKWEQGNLNTGILYNQWLGTVLQAMGVPREEFEANGDRGYGVYHAENVYGDADALWPQRLRQQAGEIVPFLKA